MSQAKVTISGRVMPDAQGTPVAVNYQIDDIANAANVAGAYASRNLSIPATKDAKRVFGAWHQGQAGASANRLPASVEVEGSVILSGVAQLDEVVMGQGAHSREATAYKVALFGNNAAWFDDLRQITIAEVVTSYVTGQTFTSAFISTNDNANPATQNWGLFLAKVKDWGHANAIDRTDLSFFVFVAPVLREAFRRVGYHMDSDFWDSSEGKRYIHALPPRPYSAEYMRPFEVYMEDNNNSTALSPLPSATQIKIAGNVANDNEFARYDSVTGFYTVAFSGHYLLSWGGDPLAFFTVVDSALNPVATTTPAGDFGAQEVVFITAGTQIQLVGASGGASTAGDVYLGIKPAFEFGLNYTVDLGALCSPSWNAADMLLGLAQAFNLRVDTDVERGRVRIEPADSYQSGGTRAEGYYRRANPIDVSRRVDLLRTAADMAGNNKKRKTKFVWRVDGADENAKKLDKSSSLPSGAARFLMSAARYQDGQEEKEVPYFAKTVMYRAVEIKNSLSTKIPILPLLQPSELNKRDSAGALIPVETVPDMEPRLLYFAGRRAGADGYVTLQLGPGPSLYDYPAAWFVPYQDHTQPSLSFSDEVSDLNETCKGLLSRFHLQDQYRRALGRTVEEYVFWNAGDIAALDFRRGIYLRGQHFILKKIEGYRPGTDRATKTILEADAPPVSGDEVIQHTSIRAIL